MNDNEILKRAAEILEDRALYTTDRLSFHSEVKAAEFFKYRLAEYEREVFGVAFLNNQNELIKFDVLFKGTLEESAVYPREVVKAALLNNAASVIFTHNHPGGTTTPSRADDQITQKLQSALDLIDIRVLDHIIVSGRLHYSYAADGKL